MTRYFRYLSCLSLGLFLFMASSNGQIINFQSTWEKFLEQDKTSNFSELTKPPKWQTANYAKYALMYATKHFCAGDARATQDLVKEIENIGKEEYSAIPGFEERFDDLNFKIKAAREVNKLWKKFLKNRDVSLADLEIEYADQICDKAVLSKFFYMKSAAHYCNGDIKNAKFDFENRVLKLVDKTSLKIEHVPGLQKNVDIYRDLFNGLPKLGKAWVSFLNTGKSDGFTEPFPVVPCFSIPSMKIYILEAASDLCGKGADMYAKIQALQKTNSHPIDKDLADKIKWLAAEVDKNNQDLTALKKAWKAFLPENKLNGEINFGFEYCDKEAQIQACLIDGIVNHCQKGQERLDDIDQLRKEFNPALSNATMEKITVLSKMLAHTEADLSKLNNYWKEFIQNKDTLTGAVDLADFYCDKIAQVKSWTIKGHLNTCESGQANLDKIDDFTRLHSLTFDKELSCSIQRLRREIWWCRYMELVRQARKETHEERERFGPQSAEIMRADLNGEELPCETTVQYEPLGNIGIKYVITAFLCQDIDLAKMGDPDYYKKIAAWVDTEVLQKYCETGMRCKEDFFIYLEGHTDGNRFRGARYKESLEIPDSTAFTHYTEDGAEEMVTRAITNTLKNNMELGIARAWTVKKQLDFMSVPITIGAYEHPEDEKGGQFRRIEIELNITNLLLDFYEKRLKILLEESGIGTQPGVCE